SGLTKPLEGQVLLHGTDVSGVPGRVSYMLQKDLLIPSKRIIDNVCLPLVIAGTPKQEARAKAAPLFERFGLEGTERQWPAQLSGGMRQRAAFLRTYLMGNDVALLDEPFSALDAITRVDLRSWYCSMATELKMASVVITHDVDEAVTMADRIYVLEGNPRGGVPTTLAGEVRVPRAEALSAADVDDFALTPEYVEVKRKVLELLG
ncbi:MAG: ATP-binding cassette domain-containing protein, partial [Atopobiaceae bacterium]|nr:ATP-binding cassette domain-containing protein [Atopobiaceae bacterium]